MFGILNLKNLFAFAGIIALLLSGQIQLSPVNNTDILPAGTIVFGPETFVREREKPKIITKTFVVENFSGPFGILIENGKNGERLVSSAVIRLNNSEVFGTNDFNQKVFNLTRDVSLQKDNMLEVEIRSTPESLLTITILKFSPNPTINNPKVDFLGTNIGDTIYFSWGPADRAAEYVLFKSLSPPGPWEEDFRLPASAGTEGVDVTPDARIKTLCYKLEALDSQGKIVRKYEPICVPQFIESASHDLPGLFKRIVPNHVCLSDAQFGDTVTMSLADIRSFLTKNGSFLRSTIPDVDGVTIDPPQVIFNAAQEFNVNPQIILATLQKEHSAVTAKTRLEEDKLKIIMGFNTSNPTTIRQQIRDGTAQFRRDFDRLTNNIPTPTGWLVGKTKASEDPVNVTPASRTVALLFSYTPWVGENWSAFGGRIGKGGNGLFCSLWAQFDFPNLVRQPATILRQFNAPMVGNGRGITFDGTHLYYTNRDDTRIFKINTQGQLLNIIQTSPAIFMRSLAWDGTQLWAARTAGRFSTVNPNTGATTPRFTFFYPATDTCYSQAPGFTDGFEFDPSTNSFWISDDAGKNVYNVSGAGATLNSFSVSPECNSGIGVSSKNLFLILYDQPNPDITFITGRFNVFTKSGKKLAPVFTTDGRLYQDAVFDSVTFSPKCALWTVQNFLPSPPNRITAFEASCD